MAEHKTDIMDYISWRGDLTFDVAPVNDIDKYIIACLGKPDYSGLIQMSDQRHSLHRVLNTVFRINGDNMTLGLLASQRNIPMLRAVKDTPRYKDLQLAGYVNMIIPENNEQFSALTVIGHDGMIYVTFRGTDDTITGWKENCELAVMETLPAQKDALEYLNWAADTFDGPITIMGHSKGGNLSIYAAAAAGPAIRDRIVEIDSFDGPGFMKEFIDDIGIHSIADRIRIFIPEKSIVGTLLTQTGTEIYIDCDEAGIFSHDGINWHTSPHGFVHADELSPAAQIFREAIDEATYSLEPASRRDIVSEILEVMSSSGALTLTDLTDNTLRQAMEISKQFKRSSEVRAFLNLLIEKGIKNAAERLRTRLPGIKRTGTGKRATPQLTDKEEIPDSD